MVCEVGSDVRYVHLSASCKAPTCRRVAPTAGRNVCFSEDSSKRASKTRRARLCSTSVLPLREPGVGGGTGHSPFKVRHHPVDALKSGCSLRSAQTTAPARGIRQLAAAIAAKLQMVSVLVPGTAAAPAMREWCARACWACTVLIPRSRAWTCCGRHQQAALPRAIKSRCTCKAAQRAFFTRHAHG